MFVEKHFNSIVDCYNYITSTFKQSFIEVENVKYNNKAGKINTLKSALVPKYLFRGENRIYPSTTSSISRVLNDTVVGETIKSNLDSLIFYLTEEIRKWLKQNEAFSAYSYLQHYGLPTRFIDATSNVDTAFFFSCFSKKLTGQGEGLVCVMESNLLHKSAFVIDLQEHPFAIRPRKQEAYGIYIEGSTDLKSCESIKGLGLKWFSFEVSDTERQSFRKNEELLIDTSLDTTAFSLMLTIYRLRKKLPDDFAKFLVEYCNLPISPLVFFEKSGEIKSYKQLGISYDEVNVRKQVYRLLSEKYLDSFDRGNAPIKILPL